MRVEEVGRAYLLEKLILQRAMQYILTDREQTIEQFVVEIDQNASVVLVS